jgi:hypothetical protein
MNANTICKCTGHGCCDCLGALPTGKTCSDCRYFIRTCQWPLSRDGTEKACDWIPSRFVSGGGETA